MGLCDKLIDRDIQGFDCTNPLQRGAERTGYIINWEDIDWSSTTFDYDLGLVSFTLKCGGKKAYTITQSGKQPWNGTQQELVEGTYKNTLTNTVQFVILKQDDTTAEDIFALANGKFVAIIQNKSNDSYMQVYGAEAGLQASAIVRELYNDDTLSGWLVTMTEEGASMPLYADAAGIRALTTPTSACS